MIRIIGPHERKKFLEDPKNVLIDVTSHSITIGRCFSPFLLGPVKLYGPYGAFNVENAWQYAKVYAEDANPDDQSPTDAYWAWAYRGWGKTRAERYPKGKGAIPLYSLWDGDRLGYVEAKKCIYVPLYEQAVLDSRKLPELVSLVVSLIKDDRNVGFFDFDGFDNVAEGMTFDDVLNSPRKLGHAFVLARMVEKELKCRSR